MKGIKRESVCLALFPKCIVFVKMGIRAKSRPLTPPLNLFMHQNSITYLMIIQLAHTYTLRFFLQSASILFYMGRSQTKVYELESLYDIHYIVLSPFLSLLSIEKKWYSGEKRLNVTLNLVINSKTAVK